MDKHDLGYPKDTTIHRLFEEQAAKRPGQRAAVFEEQELTYGELNEKANRLAHYLRGIGVGPNTGVGILAERSLEMIVAIFAVLKAGGAYLPISPTNPPQRIASILEDSSTEVLLIQSRFLDVVEKVPFLVRAVNVEDKNSYRGNPSSPDHVNKPGDLAYIIYTSGSTGKPKGVMIQHGSLVNRLYWMQKKYPLGPGDTILQKTPFFFDVSVWELFWWSMVGAGVCFLVPGGEKFPQAITAAVLENKVTVMHFVPSMLSVFLEYLRNSEEEVCRLASIKRIFSSGEALTTSQLKAFNEVLYRSNSCQLTNLYGPTEATVDVSFFDCPSSGDMEKIPIGKAIDNTRLLILGTDNREKPAGEIGEIGISGVGLARGYLNRPELTAEKFVKPAPGGRDPRLSQAQRVYKTGDLGRLLPGGNIEFLGRKDHQIKIHGLRIEMGEIEAMLVKHPDIRDAVAVVKQYSENIQMIAAYLVFNSGSDVSDRVLKDYLGGLLPGYMVPKLFVPIDRLPLTPSGKVDRKALIEPVFPGT